MPQLSSSSVTSDAPVSSDARPRGPLARAARFAYGLVATALGSVLVFRAWPELDRQAHSFPWDFVVDLRLARAFKHSYNPYTVRGAHRAILDFAPSALGHPPSTAFWALPFAGLQDELANTVLAAFTVLMVLVQAMVLAREQRWPVPLASAWLLFAAFVSSSFFSYHVSVGQLSAAIGFCVFLAWLGLRQRDSWLAGVALGAACSMKPFIAVVVFFFLLRRRFVAVGASVVVYLGIAGFMTRGFGLDSWPTFLERQKPIANLWLGNLQNQSLHGIVAHLFRPTCMPWAPIDPRATLTSLGLSLVLLGLASWLAWSLRPRVVEDEELVFAGFVVLASFISQWAWEHYNVILLVPLAILGCELARAFKERRFVLASLGTLLVLASAYCLRIPVALKRELQAQVLAGRQELHTQLHIYEALNSAPLVLLLVTACMLILARRRACRVAV